MARRRFRIFIVRPRLAEGCVFQNTKEAKAMFEDIKRDVIFGLRNAVPDRPVLLMNTYPSYRMAEALVLPELFAPSVCVGIARRLPNGRGYRVAACVPVARLLPSRNGHAYSFPEARKWLDTLAITTYLLNGQNYGKGDNVNVKDPDREYLNAWTHPDGFPKFATKEAEKLHIQDRDINSFYKDLITAPVIGIDPGSPDGDKTIIEKMGGEVHMVTDPFPHTVVTQRTSDHGIKVDFQSTLDRGLFPSKGVLDQWVALIKDVGKQKPKTVADWIRDNENSDIKNFAVVKQQLLTMSNNKPDEYALKDIRLGHPVETDDGVDVDVQFVIVPLKGQMIDIEIVNTRADNDG